MAKREPISMTQFHGNTNQYTSLASSSSTLAIEAETYNGQNSFSPHQKNQGVIVRSGGGSAAKVG